MLDTSIHVVTDQFDGPLSLLLLLIQKEEMDIQDLDLTKITQQYLDFLAEMKDLDFNMAGEYLYLAATLLLLKSKNCITYQEEAQLLNADLDTNTLKITSESELIYRLEQLQYFKKMGDKLWELPKLGHVIFTKPKVNRKAIVNSILTPMELDKLTLVMMDFLFRQKRKYIAIKRDRLSIKEKLIFLKDYLNCGDNRKFLELVDKDGERTVENTVITFISLLELARLNRISIFQNEDKGIIYIDVIKSLKDFDVHMANGFGEDEEEDEASQLDEGFAVPPIPPSESEVIQASKN